MSTHDNDDKPVRLLWVDTETTGLDPHKDPILEIGMIATGPDLKPVDDGFHTTVHWDGKPSEFIQGMHGPNGLLAECAHPSAPHMFAAAVPGSASSPICASVSSKRIRSRSGSSP